jgi:RimJ/RimL family protein N-acetyltransferase
MKPMAQPTPVVLEGTHVRLEPLSLEHIDRLCEVGLDDALWRFTPTPVRSRDDMRAYVEHALALARAGAAIPFAVVERSGGRVVGSTRYGAIDTTHRRVEIGWTWIGVAWQRTAFNTEAKYLLLRHAFESLGCIRVELKTDALNERSRRAILRIGATEEGTLRRHMITAGGRLRDTVYYSILSSEWPGVKTLLENKLGTRP